MNRPTDPRPPDALAQAIDAFGADRSRWSAEAARRFDATADDGETARALREARALDRVLARASVPTPALSSRPRPRRSPPCRLRVSHSGPRLPSPRRG